MHRLAHGVVAAKRKRNVADAAANARTWQIFFDPARRFYEIVGVIAVLVESRRDCQNVWIENNVVCRKLCLLGQQIVSALADFDLALEGVGLAFLVERHHDGGCAVSPDQLCMPQKFLFAVFHADRVHDSFALDAFQSGFDDAPLRAVDHDGNAGDFRFAADQIQEANHRRFRINHPFVHVHVEQIGAALHLLTRDRQCTFEIAGQD